MDRILVTAGAIVVLGGAIVLIARAAVWLSRVVRRVMDFLDDWAGEAARPGFPRRPGVPERLTVMEGRLVKVETELKPNAGSTLRDAIDRVERVVTPEAPLDQSTVEGKK